MSNIEKSKPNRTPLENKDQLALPNLTASSFEEYRKRYKEDPVFRQRVNSFLLARVIANGNEVQEQNQ